MSFFARINTKALPAFLRTLVWLLLFGLIPALAYGYVDTVRGGIQVFLLMSVIATLGLLWAYWRVLFPKMPVDG